MKTEILPALVDESGLNETERATADKLIEKHPALRSAAMAVVDAGGVFRSAYVALVEAAKEAKLDMPQAVLVLKRLGYIKQRITTFRRLLELTPPEFKALREGKATVNESVSLVRERKKGPGGAKKKRKPYSVDESQCSAVPDTWLPAVVNCAEKAMAGTTNVGAYRYQLKHDGRICRVFVCIDEKK